MISNIRYTREMCFSLISVVCFNWNWFGVILWHMTSTFGRQQNIQFYCIRQFNNAEKSFSLIKTKLQTTHSLWAAILSQALLLHSNRHFKITNKMYIYMYFLEYMCNYLQFDSNITRPKMCSSLIIYIWKAEKMELKLSIGFMSPNRSLADIACDRKDSKQKSKINIE